MPTPFMSIIDVRDVANVHIQAFEVASSNGRYCVAEKTVTISEAVKIINELYPSLRLNEKYADLSVGGAFQVSKEKVKNLVSNFIALEVSFKDTIESLKEKASIDLTALSV